MRLWHFVVGIIIAILLPFGFYLSYHGLVLADTQPDWGNFGSYMSGVAGPAVGAVTLIFMMLSFLQQARAASTTIFFSMVAEHEKSVRAYSTEYSQAYTGLEYLQWIWRNVASKAESAQLDEEEIRKALSVNVAELIPLVSAVVTVIHYVDDDPNFDSRTRQRYVQYFWSRLSGVEKKLLLAILKYDEIGSELRPLFTKYRQVVRTYVSTNESEILFVETLRDHALV
jgi:hypothetical protein